MTPEIGTGYRPGLLGWTVAQHGLYYAREWGFGAFFESKVARDMSDFVGRLSDPENTLFWGCDSAGFLGTLSLDGGDSDQGLAHLRWFILSDQARGRGLGRALLDRCLETARSEGVGGVYLTTFAGLGAARRLYDRAGFCLVQETEDTTWGTRVCEQRLEVRF